MMLFAPGRLCGLPPPKKKKTSSQSVGATPVGSASWAGHADAVTVLAVHGADVEIAQVGTACGEGGHASCAVGKSVVCVGSRVCCVPLTVKERLPQTKTQRLYSRAAPPGCLNWLPVISVEFISIALVPCSCVCHDTGGWMHPSLHRQ